MLANRARDGELTGLSTGFEKLDEVTLGLQKDNLIILAARPSDGKTTLALNILENIALRENKICAMFALEMTREELAQKLLCSIGRVRMDSLQKGKLSEEDEEGWQRMGQRVKSFQRLKFTLMIHPLTLFPQ